MANINELWRRVRNITRQLIAINRVELKEVSASSYTLTKYDIAPKVLRMTHNGAISLIIPDRTPDDIPIGETITVYPSDAAGVITVSAPGSATVRGDLVSAGQYKLLQLIQEEADDWLVVGGTTV